MARIEAFRSPARGLLLARDNEDCATFTCDAELGRLAAKRLVTRTSVSADSRPLCPRDAHRDTTPIGGFDVH